MQNSMMGSRLGQFRTEIMKIFSGAISSFAIEFLRRSAGFVGLQVNYSLVRI